MKNHIIMLVLSCLVFISASVSLVLDPIGFYLPASVSPVNSEIFNPNTGEVIATVLAYLMPPAAMAMSVLAALMLMSYRNKIRIDARRLAKAQFITANLVAVVAIVVVLFGFPTSYESLDLNGKGAGIYFSPGPQFLAAMLVAVLAGVLAVANSIYSFILHVFYRNTGDTETPTA